MRKTQLVQIEAEGRDKGKHFLIVEMPAMQAEKWATKALLALGRSGVEVPDDALQAGAVGVLVTGLHAFRQMRFEDAEPLLDEMMTCIHVVPDPTKTDPASGRPLTRPLLRADDFNDGDIEELSTLLKLREETVSLHVGFSIAAALSNLAAAAQQASPRPRSRTSRKRAAA